LGDDDDDDDQWNGTRPLHARARERRVRWHALHLSDVRACHVTKARHTLAIIAPTIKPERALRTPLFHGDAPTADDGGSPFACACPC